jgi:hypothetical protein
MLDGKILMSSVLNAKIAKLCILSAYIQRRDLAVRRTSIEFIYQVARLAEIFETPALAYQGQK